MSHSKNILFIVNGSIAAFKACTVISSLSKLGHHVQVVTTQNALNFVGAATFEGLTGRKPATNTFESGEGMSHIEFVRWADLIVVAPATANFINKMAHGIGDDLASTLFLAHKFDKPWLVAPAMNTAMFHHPATQESIAKLKQWGLQIISPNSGILACGEEGPGRLVEPEVLTKTITDTLSTLDLPKIPSKNILITAGGTSEYIDGVRVISNLSTGKSGTELAHSFLTSGHKVTLLHAQNVATDFSQIEKTNLSAESFTDFESLKNQLQKNLSHNSYDLVLHLAAVSDYSVDYLEQNNSQFKPNSDSKLSSDTDFSIHLKKNPKLVSYIREWSKNKNAKIVAFKLTKNASDDEILKKVSKLVTSSDIDFVIQNDLSKINKQMKEHQFNVYNNKIELIAQGKNIQEMHNVITERFL